MSSGLLKPLPPPPPPKCRAENPPSDPEPPQRETRDSGKTYQSVSNNSVSTQRESQQQYTIPAPGLSIEPPPDMGLMESAYGRSGVPSVGYSAPRDQGAYYYPQQDGTMGMGMQGMNNPQQSWNGQMVQPQVPMQMNPNANQLMPQQMQPIQPMQTMQPMQAMPPVMPQMMPQAMMPSGAMGMPNMMYDPATGGYISLSEFEEAQKRQKKLLKEQQELDKEYRKMEKKKLKREKEAAEAKEKEKGKEAERRQTTGPSSSTTSSAYKRPGPSSTTRSSYPSSSSSASKPSSSTSAGGYRSTKSTGYGK